MKMEKYSVINGTQAKTLLKFAESRGVSLSDLQSAEGSHLDALCYDLAEKLRIFLADHFVYESTADLERAYKALSNGGSI